jgi:hypothetical protein
VTVAAGLALLGTLAAHGSLQAAADEPLLRPTPLVLKDGRIANVSIHVLPFAAGRAELADGPAKYLADLTRAVGTDCFLTAQVIGHIASSEVSGDDALNAHRLARSRADAVQASLIGGGLPGKAIASVWDWQFMVREPRATLWVFELTAGEDCEGKPLRGDLVAQVPSAPEQRAAAAPERRAAAAPEQRIAAPEQPAAAQEQRAAPAPEQRAAAAQEQRAAAAPERAPAPAVTPAERPAAPAAKPPVAAQVAAAPQAAARQTAPAQAESGPARQGAPSFTEPAPVAERQAVARAEPAQPSAAAGARAAPQPPASDDGKVEPGPDGGLVITFATNSSYFPSGAAARLRDLIARIDGQTRYEVTLQVAVSGTTKVVGAKSAAEAARYNQWLAERRLERVQTWLTKNAAADALSIKPEFVADDDSRRLTVRLAPVG